MYSLKIVQDDGAVNPRKDFGHLGKMICFHKRYELGDKHNLKFNDFNNWDELENYLKNMCDAYEVVPLYLYDHSGLTINTIGFGCPWDSGQVGFIYITKKDVRDNWKNIHFKREKVMECLLSEVNEYDMYLRGEVYGYVIENDDGEHVDSCWGFYGEKYAHEEGQGMLKYLVDSEIEKRQLVNCEK